MIDSKLARLLLICIALSPLPSWSQVFGSVEAVHGMVTVSGSDGPPSVVQVGQQVSVGQTLQTQGSGEVHITTQDGGFLALRANTTFQMLQYRAEADNTGSMAMSLVRGALRSITGWIGKLNPNGYRISTPTATVGIRGTDHETTVLETSTGRDHAGTYDTVQEGATVLRNAHGELHLQAGEHGFVSHGDSLAPHRLAERPAFLAQRKLQIEDRIPERKEHLNQQLRQKLAALHDLARDAKRDKSDANDDDGRDPAKRRLLRKAIKRQAD